MTAAVRRVVMSKKPMAPIVQCLVAVPFLGVGIWLTSGFVEACIWKIRLANAVSVPAQIIDLRRVTYSTRGGGVTVHATFRYEYQGKQRTSSRLALFSDIESRYAELKAAKQSGTSVPCFVDPDDPSISVLSKDVWLPMFFGILAFCVVFSGLGGLIMFHGVKRLLVPA